MKLFALIIAIILVAAGIKAQNNEMAQNQERQLIENCRLSIYHPRHPPAEMCSSAQKPQPSPAPLSPEWVKDFTRRVIEACDRLPIGHRDRPSQEICGMPR